MTSNLFYEFGPFRLDPRKRLLWRNGEVVALKSKVFETLLVLVQNHERVLNRDELMRRLWPDAVVEENSLDKNISALRKLLGESASERCYIATVPGRGYNFVAGVRELPAKAAEGDERTVLYSAQVAAQRQEEAEKPATHSIAVLPFRWIGAESGDDYLGLGIADALIMRLSRLRQMIVRPTSSIVRYTSPGQDVTTVGRELRVATALEGSIRRAGERIRVSAQLVSVTEGRALWGGQFDEKLTDIFAVEDSVSTQIAAALALELTDGERKQLHQQYTANPEAYQFFLQGRCYFNQLPQQVEKSICCFKRAIKLDPNFALAQVELAMCYCFCGIFELAPPIECYPLAQTAVARALETDKLLAEAYVALGRIKHEYERDWTGADKAFRQAIELNPNLAVARVWYALFLSMQGREGALAEVTRAEMLDPTSLFSPSIKGVILFSERRYEEAISLLRRTLEIDPTYYVARWFLGMTYEQLGAYDEAIAIHVQTRAMSALPQAISNLGRCYALAGRRADAERMLTELQTLASRQYVSPYAFAFIHSALGENDLAFEWFEGAYYGHDPKLFNLKVNPQWDCLRGDPRFADLLRRMGMG
ncbi:MAG: winged helix-turn-helix domain-containing protein [Blastocatellia bacterium]